ncbi:MAG: hypothetical protein QN187_00975 [Armatimonadota bacterium]|nr:hypothetical protein [Armatimonadota bacterium]MDR7520660.1 hypothetical protein [Armatimonadota bacterium]MDR7550253.1 hypothetical protein [Armatimonadota bacterium]
MAAAAGVASSAPAATSPAPEAARPGSVLEVVEIGFSGRARLGAWTPVWIDVAAPTEIDGTLIIEAPAPAGQPVVRFGAPVRAAAGARVRTFVPAIFFDASAPGVVHLVDGGGHRASVVLPRLRPVDELVLILSREPVGVEEAIEASDRLEVAYGAAELLPPVWLAYEGVRLLVVRTLDERRLDDAQRTAIRNWVWAGGRLVAMPEGDDARVLAGPTLEPFRRPGQAGRGRVIVWAGDAASPGSRADPRTRQAWRQALAPKPQPLWPGLEATLPGGPVLPVRTYLLVGALVALYIVAVRRLNAGLSSLRPTGALTAALVVALATAGAWRLAAFVRRQASGVVASTVVEVMPPTGSGLLTVLARTSAAPDGAFEIAAAGTLLLRPLPTAPVTVVHGTETILRGRGAGIQVLGMAVVPAAISGTYAAGNAGATVTVTNRSGRPLEQPWVFVAGRVQAIPPIVGTARLVLDEQHWQPHDRLSRTQVHHALLVWAFSRLAADAILSATPAWLVGWWRDPVLALRWDGRIDAPLQLVLVPLTAPP